MPDTPRHIISDIQVDKNGDWFSGKSKIINQQVLTFFKKNLHADVNGLFIYNEFGAKAEKAYIRVNGPVLKIIAIENEQFILDNDERVDIAKKELAMDRDEKIYIVVDRLKAWALFSKEAIHQLGERLTQKNNVYYWNQRAIRTINEIPWFFG